MKHLSKIFTVLALFSFCAAMGGIFSTDVYLINKTNVPLIRGPIETTVANLTFAGLKRLFKGLWRVGPEKITRQESSIKINPGEKKKLLSVPRAMLPPKMRLYTKDFSIRKEGERRPAYLSISSSLDATSFLVEPFLKPTTTKGMFIEEKNWQTGLILKKKFVLKLGKLYSDLHITALPSK